MTMPSSRPIDMPSAEHFDHGTRSKYVCGCRCEPCRAANRASYHERQRRGRELAASIPVRAGAEPAKCPGVLGAPCPTKTRLYRNSASVCERCLRRLSFNGLVDAGPARKHLRYLSRSGVGRDSVSAACDVGVTALSEIFRGIHLRIRAETERRILAVTSSARADASTVPAGPTWRLIGKLLERGFTQGDIARALGRKTPALQLRRDRVLARTEMQVRRLFKTIGEPPEHGTRWNPRFCDCISPQSRDGRCEKCNSRERPNGMTRALIGGAPEVTKAVQRAFGFEGGWGFDQRQSKKAKKVEAGELRKLARQTTRIAA